MVKELSRAPVPSIRAFVSQRLPTSPSTSSCKNFRQVVPKTKLGTLNLRDQAGEVASSLRSYDAALRETRHFWEAQPIDHDSAWNHVLDSYSQNPSFPKFEFPTQEIFSFAVVKSKDSAPGPDGIPYAFYRSLPKQSIQVLGLLDIISGDVPPASQALVFIPKADFGDKADNYRPLDMPNTVDRLLDSVVYAVASQAISDSLRPAQSLINVFKEPPSNFAATQAIRQTQITMSFSLI